MEYPPGFFAKTAVVEEQGVDDIVEWDRSGGATGGLTEGVSEGEEEEEEEGDVITMGPASATATKATKPATKGAKPEKPEKPAKADEWTGRRGGKREDTGDLDIDNI
jgi:hypothetical protein